MSKERVTVKTLKDEIERLKISNEGLEQWIVGLIGEIDRLQGRVNQLENLALDYEQELVQDEQDLINVLSSFAAVIENVRKEFGIK
ncbi:hypothetical protein DFV88_24865 [Salmonella enterica subsp. enterica serovar Newport]|nr:hypothetical protein [Salmonella enterica subsp. enterica serovar Newport]